MGIKEHVRYPEVCLIVTAEKIKDVLIYSQQSGQVVAIKNQFLSEANSFKLTFALLGSKVKFTIHKCLKDGLFMLVKSSALG